MSDQRSQHEKDVSAFQIMMADVGLQKIEEKSAKRSKVIQTLWPAIEGMHIVEWHTSSLGDKRGPGSMMCGPRDFVNSQSFSIDVALNYFVRETFAPKHHTKAEILKITPIQLRKLATELGKIECVPGKFEGDFLPADYAGRHTFFVEVQLVNSSLDLEIFLREGTKLPHHAASLDGKKLDQGLYSLDEKHRVSVLFDDTTGEELGKKSDEYPAFRFPKSVTHESLAKLLNSMFDTFAEERGSEYLRVLESDGWLF